MKANLDDIRKRAMTVRSYIDSLSGKDKDIILEVYEEYNLDMRVVEVSSVLLGAETARLQCL
jgi:hypothetical protein